MWNLSLTPLRPDPPGAVLGGGVVGRLAGDQTQTFGANDMLAQNEAVTSAGQLGVLAQVTKCTTVKLTGQFKKQNSEAQVYEDLAGMSAMDRDRTSTVLRFKADSNPVRRPASRPSTVTARATWTRPSARAGCWKRPAWCRPPTRSAPATTPG